LPARTITLWKLLLWRGSTDVDQCLLEHCMIPLHIIKACTLLPHKSLDGTDCSVTGLLLCHWTALPSPVLKL
jgi:hypothetical protein